MDPIPIYVCPVKGTEIFQRRYRAHSTSGLLEILENFLASKNFLKKDMNVHDLPNVGWLCTVLHREDPEDKFNLFNEPIQINSFERIVNTT